MSRSAAHRAVFRLSRLSAANKRLIPLSHLCGLSTVARGSRVYGFPQVFRGPGTSFLRYDHGDLAIPAVWCVSDSGASSTVQCVIWSTRMTYGNHGVVTFYTRMAAARYAVSSRMRAVYCTNIYTVDSRIFTDIRGGFANIRVFYTGFVEALRLLRYRRFSYGV